MLPANIEQRDVISGRQTQYISFCISVVALLFIGHTMFVGQFSGVTGVASAALYFSIGTLLITLGKSIGTFDFKRKLTRYRSRDDMIEMTPTLLSHVDPKMEGVKLFLIQTDDMSGPVDFSDLPGVNEDLRGVYTPLRFHAFLRFADRSECVLFKIKYSGIPAR